jgi:hypothetical protein
LELYFLPAPFPVFFFGTLFSPRPPPSFIFFNVFCEYLDDFVVYYINDILIFLLCKSF